MVVIVPAGACIDMLAAVIGAAMLNSAVEASNVMAVPLVVPVLMVPPVILRLPPAAVKLMLPAFV